MLPGRLKWKSWGTETLCSEKYFPDGAGQLVSFRKMWVWIWNVTWNSWASTALMICIKFKARVRWENEILSSWFLDPSKGSSSWSWRTGSDQMLELNECNGIKGGAAKKKKGIVTLGSHTLLPLARYPQGMWAMQRPPEKCCLSFLGWLVVWRSWGLGLQTQRQIWHFHLFGSTLPGSVFKLKEGKLKSNIWRKFLPVRVVRPLHILSREAMDAQSLKMLKTRLDGALRILV